MLEEVYVGNAISVGFCTSESLGIISSQIRRDMVNEVTNLEAAQVKFLVKVSAKRPMETYFVDSK